MLLLLPVAREGSTPPAHRKSSRRICVQPAVFFHGCRPDQPPTKDSSHLRNAHETRIAHRGALLCHLQWHGNDRANCLQGSLFPPLSPPPVASVQRPQAPVASTRGEHHPAPSLTPAYCWQACRFMLPTLPPFKIRATSKSFDFFHLFWQEKKKKIARGGTTDIDSLLTPPLELGVDGVG